MFDLSVQQLDSPDPAVRRNAIIALGKSADGRALNVLAKVYRTDPDPALRELALKAGQHIKTTTGAQAVVQTPITVVAETITSLPTSITGSSAPPVTEIMIAP